MPLAVAAAISPFPIIGMVLMLTAGRGRTNALMYAAGWLAGLAAIAAATLLLAGAGDVGADDAGSGGVDALRIALGLGLFALAGRQWTKRPRADEDPPLPRWMNAVDAFSPRKAATTGIVMSAVNPKNLFLTVAAGTTIATSGLATGQRVAAFVVYGVVASIGVGAPLVLSVALGDRADERLDAMQKWLARNNATIMTVVLVVIGANVLGNGIAGR